MNYVNLGCFTLLTYATQSFPSGEGIYGIFNDHIYLFKIISNESVEKLKTHLMQKELI